MNDPAESTLKKESMLRPLRWGILGAARIARKAVAGAIQAQGGTLAAIGASTLARAEQFAGEFRIPRVFEGYQGVLDCEDVEAVYLPLANGLHFRWALACARAGKHCLCEKPMVLAADEARQLREAFARAGCRIAEAFMWRHHPQTEWIESQVREGELGELRRIHAAFSFTLDRAGDFRWLDQQGGGAFYDIGGYCVNAMRFFFGEEPVAVSARARFTAPGARTDHSTVGWLDFGGDRLGTFECSYVSAYAQNLTLVGSAGLLRVERPFTGLGVASACTLQVGDQLSERRFPPDNAYERMIAHFTTAARDPSFALQPAEDGLAQASAMEALTESAAREDVSRVTPGY